MSNDPSLASGHTGAGCCGPSGWGHEERGMAMRMTTIDQILRQPWSDETHTWVRNCARELHVIFDTMGWTWSGQPVTEDDLVNKIIGLCVDVTKTLETGDAWTAISSGRVRVEGRRPFTDSDNISIWVHLCTYIPGDSKQFDV